MSVLDRRTAVRFAFEDLEALLGIHGADGIIGINALGLDRHVVVGITGPGFAVVPPWHEAPIQRLELVGSRAMLDVAIERRRQPDELGYDAQHDDEHGHGALIDQAIMLAYTRDTVDREDLVKSAALLLAAIDVIDRAAHRAQGMAQLEDTTGGQG